MSKSLINSDRFVFDFIIALLQTALLTVLFMKIIDLDPINDISGQIILVVISIVIIITIIHSYLCKSDIYRWKFAFLLPNDFFYYITIKNRSNLTIDYEEIKIILPRNSTFFFMKPIEIVKSRRDLERASHFHPITCKIKKLANYESKDIVLWLYIDCVKALKIKHNTAKLDVSYGHCEWDCGKPDIIGSIYLLLSKNVILLLARSTLLAFLILYILLQNPPLNIVTEPMQIQENWTEGENHSVDISAKNIGCNLLQANLSFPNSGEEQFIDAKWSSGENPMMQFVSGAVKFIKLRVQNSCPPGEYRGFIIIRANATRNIGFPFYHNIGNTSTMKLTEVPVFIRITPSPNATA